MSEIDNVVDALSDPPPEHAAVVAAIAANEMKRRRWVDLIAVSFFGSRTE
jgi:F420-0:gamma-glutamyl ligase-like protein